MQVAADAAESGKPSTTLQRRRPAGAAVASLGHVAAGGGEELRAQQRADAGHAGNHRRGAVAAKPVLDELVGVAEGWPSLVASPWPGRQLRGSGQALTGQRGALAGGGSARFGQACGAVDMPAPPATLPAAPGPSGGSLQASDPRSAAPPARRRSGRALVPGRGRSRSSRARIPVDRRCSGRDRCLAPLGEDLQLRSDLITGPQRLQVPGHGQPGRR